MYNSDLMQIAILVRSGVKPIEEVYADISNLPGEEKHRQAMKTEFDKHLAVLKAHEEEVEEAKYQAHSNRGRRI